MLNLCLIYLLLNKEESSDLESRRLVSVRH